MKKQQVINEGKRRSILIELERNPKKFVEIKKRLELDSNILSYNLKILIREGLVEKEDIYLTSPHSSS